MFALLDEEANSMNQFSFRIQNQKTYLLLAYIGAHVLRMRESCREQHTSAEQSNSSSPRTCRCVFGLSSSICISLWGAWLSVVPTKSIQGCNKRGPPASPECPQHNYKSCLPWCSPGLQPTSSPYYFNLLFVQLNSYIMLNKKYQGRICFWQLTGFLPPV